MFDCSDRVSSGVTPNGIPVILCLPYHQYCQHLLGILINRLITVNVDYTAVRKCNSKIETLIVHLMNLLQYTFRYTDAHFLLRVYLY